MATQVGALSIGTSPSSSCPVAAWATIGAGRTVEFTGPCTPALRDGRPLQWSAVQSAAAQQGVTLGVLAASTTGCVAAVGPGGAISAARADGSLDHFETLTHFLASGGLTSCPLTLVDAGADAAAVARLLADRPNLTLIVAGVAEQPSARPVGVQPIYELGSGPMGWLTSTSTRRPGIVTLPDLHATLLQLSEAGRGGSAMGDGAAFRVRPAALRPASERDHLRDLAAVPAGLAVGDVALAVIVALAGTGVVVGWARGRPGWRRTGTGVLLALPTAAALTGAAPWNRAASPGLALCLVLVPTATVLTTAASAAARRWRVPVAVVAAGLLVAVLSVDAATGGMLQQASLLNPRPLDGGRWYGFGNLTFALYACSALVLVGYLLQRARRTGRGAILAVGVGVGVVLSDAWPGMGADLGGGLALGTTMAWLLLGLASRGAGGIRPLLAGVGGVALVGTLAWLDWLRGPSRRTHLGGFVQRVLDADAGGLISRKVIAVGASVANRWGLAALVAGGLVWVLVVRSRRKVQWDLAGFNRLAVAVFATALLGTVLNDSGVVVWTAITASFGVTVLALAADADSGAVRASSWRRHRPAGLRGHGPARGTTPGRGFG